VSFWHDFSMGFTNTITDIGTSATRILTDTAIDLGNVATGFQFQDKMDEAKKKLSDAGVLSTSDAIEKRYYDFLSSMRTQAQNKHDELVYLYPLAQQAEKTRNDTNKKLGQMLDDVKLLAQISLEGENILARVAQSSYWNEWAKLSNAPLNTLNHLKTSCRKWDIVCQKILISQTTVNVGSGALETTSIIISRLSQASYAVKASELSEASALTSDAAKSAEVGIKAGSEVVEAVGTVGKLAKIGRIAGRASAVLAVASIGLDIGLSISQLENQKKTLQQNIDALNIGIAEAKQDIFNMNTETVQINERIQELLVSVTPPVDERNWDNWVKQEQEKLSADLNKLTSVVGIYQQAIKMAEATHCDDYDERIEEIQSVDSSITADMAKHIIESVDGSAKISS
jgi:hypothetical protein